MLSASARSVVVSMLRSARKMMIMDHGNYCGGDDIAADQKRKWRRVGRGGSAITLSGTATALYVMYKRPAKIDSRRKIKGDT